MFNFNFKTMMRIVRFKKSLFTETQNGNYYSRVFNAFCTRNLWEKITDSGWGIVDSRTYENESGEFTRLELLAVLPSLSEAREILAASAASDRINKLSEEEIDQLIAEL
jgi:hypothetical protein